MITNDTIDYSKSDFDLGETILIDKPFGWTSFHVVHKIRKAVGVKKVGHAGTLDPFGNRTFNYLYREKNKRNFKIPGIGKNLYRYNYSRKNNSVNGFRN